MPTTCVGGGELGCRALQQYPVIAAEILGPIRGAEEIGAIVLAHHECPDTLRFIAPIRESFIEKLNVREHKYELDITKARQLLWSQVDSHNFST